MILHQKSYKSKKFLDLPHKKRLNSFFPLIRNLNLPKEGKWADFGCSDGFILNLFKKEKEFKNWKMYGFDNSDELLQKGEKDYPEINFKKMNLNIKNNDYENFFDIVSCFETLEHVGNYKNAFDNLYFKLKLNGTMIVSVPDEVFLRGAVKFLARYFKKRNPDYDPRYDLMLKRRQDRFYYFFDLLFKRDIEKYRKYPVEHYGPHLGFNYRNLEKYVHEQYIKKNKLSLLKNKGVFFGFNKIYLFKKIWS